VRVFAAAAVVAMALAACTHRDGSLHPYGALAARIGSSLSQEVNTTGEAIIIRRMAIERYFFIFMTFRF
jgi:hypothetical protein